MTTQDRIFAAASVLLLLGAGARLSQSSETTRVIWPEIPSLPEASGGRSAELAASQMERALAGNVFSVARAAPGVRFRLGAEPQPESTPAQSEALPPPMPPPPPRYRVAGTMINGTGGFALIDADPSTAGPEVYRQGDAVGGYRLEQVAYDHVVLVGPMGEIRMDVARPGETPRPQQSFQAPHPSTASAQPAPVFPRATSSANTPPGAIPPGW